METIKEELEIDLEEEEEETNPFEYNKDELIDIVDDTWISTNDREKLINHLKISCSLEFSWADKNLVECIIKKKYYNIVNSMDRKQYETDKNDPMSSTFSV